ncbi:MAG: hypothetical protein ACK5D5_05855 [Bacteroidota bacterium]
MSSQNGLPENMPEGLIVPYDHFSSFTYFTNKSSSDGTILKRNDFFKDSTSIDLPSLWNYQEPFTLKNKIQVQSKNGLKETWYEMYYTPSSGGENQIIWSNENEVTVLVADKVSLMKEYSGCYTRYSPGPMSMGPAFYFDISPDNKIKLKYMPDAQLAGDNDIYINSDSLNQVFSNVKINGNMFTSDFEGFNQGWFVKSDNSKKKTKGILLKNQSNGKYDYYIKAKMHTPKEYCFERHIKGEQECEEEIKFRVNYADNTVSGTFSGSVVGSGASWSYFGNFQGTIEKNKVDASGKLEVDGSILDNEYKFILQNDNTLLYDRKIYKMCKKK